MTSTTILTQNAQPASHSARNYLRVFLAWLICFAARQLYRFCSFSLSFYEKAQSNALSAADFLSVMGLGVLFGIFLHLAGWM